MSRALAVLAAVLAAVGMAFAQSQPPAPATHPGTKLNFPPTLGGAQFERSFTFPIGRETAYSYHYGANKMQISVYIYDGGRRVAPGSDNPAVINHFADELQNVDRSLKTSGYTSVERPSVPSICTFASIAFRCVVYSASGQGGRLFSKLMLTGFHDHFVKIRIDWAQGNGQTTADADKVLQSFIPALMH